jgi:radical SAM superfamily enzyme with C-terminal helix-hairpin-helix motif
MSSGIQDRLLNNTAFIEYMLDLHTLFKSDNMRKIQVFFGTLIAHYDTRNIKHSRLTEVLMNTVAAHKLNLMLNNHSIIMLAIRSLLILTQRRLSNLKAH